MTVWDVINGREISTFGVDLGQFWHSSFSRDGTKVVNGSFDGIARVFDAESGDLLETYRGHAGAVEHAILSDDGSRLLTSSVDHTARLWDTDDKTELRRYFHGDEVAQATLSADGTHVFTASRDGTARSWSVRETEEFLFKASDAEVDGLAFASGGDLLAGVGGEDIRIYDLAAQRLVLEEKSRSPKLVAFRPLMNRYWSHRPTARRCLTDAQATRSARYRRRSLQGSAAPRHSVATARWRWAAIPWNRTRYSFGPRARARFVSQFLSKPGCCRSMDPGSRVGRRVGSASTTPA